MSDKMDLQKKSDEDLMELYKKDSQMAFEILYLRHASKVIGYLTQKSRSPKLAQDLAQEVFLKLHRSRHQFSQMLPFSPWLFSIARSVFLDFVKRKSLEDITESHEFDKLHSSSTAVSESDSIDLTILPELQKQVVNLRIYDEATFEEIASRLYTSPDNARQIFSRAVKNLRSYFEKKGRN